VGDHPPDVDYGADIADYSAVRVLILLDNERIIRPSLVVRNLDGGLAGIARVRVVKFWAHPDGAPLPNDNDFSDWGDDDGHDESSPRRAPPGRFDSQRQTTLPRRDRAGPQHAGAPGASPWRSGTCRSLGPVLYPSVPLWTFVAGARSALGRALSLAGVPQVVIRDLPTPSSPTSPPPTPRICELVEALRPPSSVPTLEDLLLAEEHEVSARKRRARRKRAHDSAAKTRRHSLRLAAKEDPYYVDATSKATRVKAAQLDLTRASTRMKMALAQSGVLERPAPSMIASSRLRCLGRVCGLPNLSDKDDDAVPAN